jgi:hypothetical protein
MELCEAILHPNKAGAETMLQQYLARIDDALLKRALATVLDVKQGRASFHQAAVKGLQCTMADAGAAVAPRCVDFMRKRQYGLNSSGRTYFPTGA